MVKLITIGKVGRAHGIRGELRIFVDESTQTLSYVKKLCLNLNGKKTWYDVEKVRHCGRFYAVKLRGIDDRDAAFAQTGAIVRIDRTQLEASEDNRWYCCDLEACDIFDEDGVKRAVVTSVSDNGAQDLLNCRSERGIDFSLPLVEAYNIKIDTGAHSIVVSREILENFEEIFGTTAERDDGYDETF